jgi:hypothetical protein
MRKLSWIAGIALFLQFSGTPSTLFAQGFPVDYGPVIIVVDDTAGAIRNDAVIQAGYAVVTVVPFPGAGTTLAAMTTVGLKSDTVTTQTTFATPGLTASASIFVDVSERLGRNVGISLVNPSDFPASVTLVIRGGNGAQLAARTITLAGRQQLAQFVTALVPLSAPTTEITGTLSIESTTPLSVTSIRFGGSTFSAVPATNLGVTSSLPEMSLGVGGPNALLLPLFVEGRGWATQIALSNPGSSTVVFRLDLFKNDGSPMTANLNGRTGISFINFAIAKGGVVVLAPRNATGDGPF